MPLSGPTTTYHAPAGRADPAELARQHEAAVADAAVGLLLKAVPDIALVLNPQRQVVAANESLLRRFGVADADELLGLRPGEAVGCVNVEGAPEGCGTGEDCRQCGAVNAILECLQYGGVASRECRIQTRRAEDGGALDLRVQATAVQVGGYDLVVVALQDISAEKRREVLESLFFHDVLNAAGGIRCLAELLLDGDHPELEDKVKHDVYQLSGAIVEEIRAHRQLLAAERGDLELDWAVCAAGDILDAVASAYRHHELAGGRTMVVEEPPATVFTTDPTLLRRVLGNLVKNALEATPSGGEVRLGATAREGAVVFAVHNPGCIPADVASQIFQRSFSTKGQTGRGIGTYSIKLFTERYLGGRVRFSSDAAEGTTFTVALPLKPAGGGRPT